jgi:prolipoprotein diacylglyceryl transferase
MTPEFQRSVVSAINQALDDPHFRSKEVCSTRAENRIVLQELLPEAISSLRSIAIRLTDKLSWYSVIGTVIGARLGFVFFYQWDYFSEHLAEIPKTWNGGLASHGGTVGVLIGAYFYFLSVKKYMPHLTFLGLADLMAAPGALIGVFIRLGNFFNQEVLGAPTTLPWGIVFGNPMDDRVSLPRHPVQLYEAILYFSIFCVLYQLAKRRQRLGDGFLLGLLFVLVFIGRILLEFLKVPQGGFFGDATTGQWLSVPFVFIGLALLWIGYRKNGTPKMPYFNNPPVFQPNNARLMMKTGKRKR